MKTIFILSDDPYHENDSYFGAYTSKEDAIKAALEYVPAKSNPYHRPNVIIEINLDSAASHEAEVNRFELPNQ